MPLSGTGITTSASAGDSAAAARPCARARRAASRLSMRRRGARSRCTRTRKRLAAAARRDGLLDARRRRASMIDELAGLDLAHEPAPTMSSAQRLGGEHRAARRARPARAGGCRRGSRTPISGLGREQRRPRRRRGCATSPRSSPRAGGRVLGDQRADHLGVGRRVEVHAARDELVAQLGGVREVAVVAERDGAAAAVADDRLRVLPGAPSRSSSSGCGRSRRRRRAPCSFDSSKTCETRPISRSAVRGGRRRRRCPRSPGRGAAARTCRSR